MGSEEKEGAETVEGEEVEASVKPRVPSWGVSLVVGGPASVGGIISLLACPSYLILLVRIKRSRQRRGPHGIVQADDGDQMVVDGIIVLQAGPGQGGLGVGEVGGGRVAGEVGG